jgi:hypothetical protein
MRSGELQKEEQPVAMKIMQGDACRIPFCVKQDGRTLVPEMITDLEVTVGRLRKTYREGNVTWDGAAWYVYLSQEETMAMSGVDHIRIRVRYLDQPWVSVQGKEAALLYVEEHPTGEVL